MHEYRLSFESLITVSPACGSTVAENNTYLTYNDGDTFPTDNVCFYKICKAVPTVTRIRLDFDTFLINGPETAVNSAQAASDTDGKVVHSAIPIIFI